jgi:phosphatidylinositol alpha 1,6-mannosyltransferase
VRVAIVTESFLPSVNGVTNSVCRVLEHLERRGHQAMVVAPGPGPAHHGSVPVVRVRSASLPCYRSFEVGLPDGRLDSALAAFRPDVVHLAAPVVLGAAAIDAARRLDVPTVAIYQTDLAGFVRRYRVPVLSRLIWRSLRRVHEAADLTLAPSTSAAWELRRHGVDRVAIWARGVDAERFHPGHRDPMLRRRLAPEGQVIVGFVGRLAREKRVELLRHVQGVPGVQLVVAGDGPRRAKLERRLPGATFTGHLSGAELAALVASLDLFVNTGADETFCQAVQEALAAGVPVLAAAAGGPLDLVQHGVNGWLWPADRPDVLGPAIATLVADPARRKAMGRAARRSVQHRTWSSVGDELLGHYAAVLAGAGSLARVA